MSGVCFKQKFETVQKARDHAKALERKNGIKIHIYYCSPCAAFHMTKMSRKQKRDFDRQREADRKGDRRARW